MGYEGEEEDYNPNEKDNIDYFINVCEQIIGKRCLDMNEIEGYLHNLGCSLNIDCGRLFKKIKEKQGENMFNSPELQRIHEESKPIIEAHLKNLDDVSNDIRTLKDLLLKSAIFTDSLKFDVFIGNELEGSLIWNGDAIIWKSGEDFRPLIQTPVRVRLMCKDFLGDFYKFCINSIEGGE